MIVLDTHVLVWLDGGASRLGSSARAALDRALAEDGLAVSAISFWEVGMLVEKGRLSLGLDLTSWRIDLLRAGLAELPVTGEIAIAAARLAAFHGDPSDRLIVATALLAGARVCTADAAILDWNGPVLRADAAA